MNEGTKEGILRSYLAINSKAGPSGRAI